MDIAVLISTKNEQDRILSVVESALLISSEIIVIDNESTDDTVQILGQIPEVTVVSHQLPITDYVGRIRLGLEALKKNGSGCEYIAHLNCSENFTERMACYLQTIDLKKYSAIAVYRKTWTDGYPTHPYHVLYLIRSLLNLHKTYRIIAVDQWDESQCRIHSEWKPKQKTKVLSIPFWRAAINYQRDGDIDLNNKKHALYADCESKDLANKGRPYLVFNLFRRPVLYFLYNLPYLLTRYSDQRLVSVVQHCEYLSSVYLRAIRQKSKR